MKAIRKGGNRSKREVTELAMLMRKCWRSTTAVATAIVAVVKTKNRAVADVATAAGGGDAAYSLAIVLGMDLHCMSCAKKVKNVTMDIPGVEKVTVELWANRVAVTGTVDAAVLATSVAVRTRRAVTVVSDPRRQVGAGEERIRAARAPGVEAQQRAAEQEALNRAAAEEREREKRKEEEGSEGRAEQQEQEEVVAPPPQIGTGSQAEEWMAELRIAGLHCRRCMSRIVGRVSRFEGVKEIRLTLPDRAAARCRGHARLLEKMNGNGRD